MDHSTSSILRIPGAIAILANEDVLHEVIIFLETLQLWNQVLPPVYCMCTNVLMLQMKKLLKQYNGEIYYKCSLDEYGKCNRYKMEATPSKKGLSNRWHDFMQEKCDCLEWALQELSEQERPNGVLFCDVDIIWTAPLFEIPVGKTLGLSQHMIRKTDEEKFGEFNGGFMWTNHCTIPDEWEQASKRSRFYEQAALEELADNTSDDELFRFPETVNYGWWRMFQSDQSSSSKQLEWRIIPYKEGQQNHSGICVNTQPLVCIHTHIQTNDTVTSTFNTFFFKCLETAAKTNTDTKRLYEILNKHLK